MANDITGPMALPIFRQMADQVYDKDKVVLVPDHFTPNKDIKSGGEFPKGASGSLRKRRADLVF